MAGTDTLNTAMAAVSRSMVALHKEQFGRGPTRARSHFAGPDVLVCVLEDALLPAERKLVAMGETGRVRDSRVAFQAATEDEFVEAVEQIIYRKVRAFASAVDPRHDTVFEVFSLEPESSDGLRDADGLGNANGLTKTNGLGNADGPGSPNGLSEADGLTRPPRRP